MHGGRLVITTHLTILWILCRKRESKHKPKLINFTLWAYSLRPIPDICLFLFSFSFLVEIPTGYRLFPKSLVSSLHHLWSLSLPRLSSARLAGLGGKCWLASPLTVCSRSVRFSVRFISVLFVFSPFLSRFRFIQSHRLVSFCLSLPIFTAAIIVAILLHCSQLREFLSSQSFHSTNPNNFFILVISNYSISIWLTSLLNWMSFCIFAYWLSSTLIRRITIRTFSGSSQM